jgi:hypothetical protein
MLIVTIHDLIPDYVEPSSVAHLDSLLTMPIDRTIINYYLLEAGKV